MQTDYEVLSEKYRIALKKVKSESSLAKLLNEKIKTSEMKRIKRFSSLLEAFHLKNTITTDVSGRFIVLNDKQVRNFSSANYLGFDQHPKVIEAAIEGLKRMGNHSGCSRLFSSHSNIIKLEEEVAKLVGAQSSLICANVSQTHAGAIPALFTGEDCEILVDRYAHTSLFQASLVAKAKGSTMTRVNVDDLKELKTKLKRSVKGTKVLLVDGLYSMQGNIPDIISIQKLCDETNTILYIDDAHGVGIYGENGGGVAELLNLKFDNMILVGSLQKGLGAFGAFIAGSETLIDLLRVTSKTYIFSGTLQPQAVDGALAAIEISRSEEGKQLRSDLYKKSQLIRNELSALRYKVLDAKGNSPIISVEMGSDLRTLMAGKTIFDNGIYLNSVVYPAVPKNNGILRISLNSVHSDEDIKSLLDAFKMLRTELDNNFNSLTENFSYFLRIARSKLGRN
ncbi:MAG: pyridoxal phosphate-dependent aminotransferase family protein [Bacteriovorax sp.]|nr:pyridoxal phosphate-dependent aminotransferase family protein [Bacteriovorax sp.]